MGVIRRLTETYPLSPTTSSLTSLTGSAVKLNTAAIVSPNSWTMAGYTPTAWTLAYTSTAGAANGTENLYLQGFSNTGAANSPARLAANIAVGASYSVEFS